MQEKVGLYLPGLEVAGGGEEASTPATPGEPLSQLHHKHKVPFPYYHISTLFRGAHLGLL